MKPFYKKYQSRGGVLILSLWILMFLSLLAVYAGALAHQKIEVSKRIEQRIKLYDTAISGFEFLRDALAAYDIRDYTPDIQSLHDYWTQDQRLFKKISVGEGICDFSYTYYDNTTYRKKTCTGLIDEERKIPLQVAPYEVLIRLFAEEGCLPYEQAANLAAAVIDWQDEDDLRYNGGENVTEIDSYGYYRYKPRNALLTSVEELLLIKGMTLEVFMRIRDYVTVFTDYIININTAPRPVLSALGLSRELIDKIIRFRSGVDMIEGTADDNPFTHNTRIIHELSRGVQLTNDEVQELLDIMQDSPRIATVSETFRGVCTSTVSGMPMKGKLIVVFRRNGDVLYWGYNVSMPGA